MGKHWIVLVNKSPRGPLSYEEVSTLLSEKILKRTDLALQVSDQDQTEKSDWKFLWQYPEFDLRAQNNTANTKNKSDEVERRSSVDPAKLQSKVVELLPEEIAMINPEDLVVSAKRNRPKTIQSFLSNKYEDGVDVLPYSSSEAKGSGGNRSYAVIAILLLLVGFYVRGILKGLTDVVPGTKTTSAETSPNRAISSDLTDRKASKNLESVKRRSSVAPLSAVKSNEDTKPPGKNEITLEEYERLKSERADRDREEEEDRRKEEEEAEKLAESKAVNQDEEVTESESTNEEMEVPLKRAKSKKQGARKSQKRKVAEDSEADQDSSESQDAANDSESPSDTE